MNRVFLGNRRFWGSGLLLVSVLCLLWACGGSGKKSHQAVLRVHFAKFKPGDSLLLAYETGDTIFYRRAHPVGIAFDTAVIDSSGILTYNKQITDPLYVKLYYLKGKRLSEVESEVFIDVDSTIVEVDSVRDPERKARNLAVVTHAGGVTQQEFTGYQEYARPLTIKLEALGNTFLELLKLSDYGTKMSKPLAARMDSVRSQFTNAYYIEKYSLDSEYIAKHPKSIVSAWLLGNLAKAVNTSPLGSRKALTQVEQLLPLIDKSLTTSIYLKNIDVLLRDLRRLAQGIEAPDFKLPTPKGDTVSLSSFRGKFVVLDFWASWCGPCRMANPHVVKLYHKFKDKGVQFLGVSLDENKSDWVKAIEKDKLTWVHVSDLKDGVKEVAASYGVNSIPASFLINPEGKIIGEFSSDVQYLDAALEEATK